MSLRCRFCGLDVASPEHRPGVCEWVARGSAAVDVEAHAELLRLGVPLETREALIALARERGRLAAERRHD